LPSVGRKANHQNGAGARTDPGAHSGKFEPMLGAHWLIDPIGAGRRQR
jgi:hypothetical protein